MRVVLFSGTTEGRAFSKQLGALGADVLVSVATDLGAEEQGSAPGVTVRAGRLEPEEMTALLQGADLCIDATHPYAAVVTQNIAAACKKETVQTIQNRFGGFFILDFRQQHGNPARAEHRLHVVFADKHLAVGDIVRTGNADQRAIHFDSPFLFSSLFFLSFLPKDSL